MELYTRSCQVLSHVDLVFTSPVCRSTNGRPAAHYLRYCERDRNVNRSSLLYLDSVSFCSWGAHFSSDTQS